MRRWLDRFHHCPTLLRRRCSSSTSAAWPVSSRSSWPTSGSNGMRPCNDPSGCSSTYFPEIAERLKRQEYPIADRFDDVSVLFADMVGFTERSAAEAPDVTVAVLNEFLGAFDELAQQHGLRPIRITGDSYLVVGGLPVPRPDHAQAIANMALDMLDRINRLNQQHGWAVGFRIGLNSGPAMAAVVGRLRFTYDVWSDTVNTASRMESSGIAGRIQVTEEIYRRLSQTHQFECRGQIDIKGKGPMTTYFLTGRQ